MTMTRTVTCPSRSPRTTRNDRLSMRLIAILAEHRAEVDQMRLNLRRRDGWSLPDKTVVLERDGVVDILILDLEATCSDLEIVLKGLI